MLALPALKCKVLAGCTETNIHVDGSPEGSLLPVFCPVSVATTGFEFLEKEMFSLAPYAFSVRLCSCLLLFDDNSIWTQAVHF